jgi:hypothetical protein
VSAGNAIAERKGLTGLDDSSATALIEGTLLGPNDWTPEQAAGYVTAAWQGAVESIVETGRRLTEVKERVGHGNWLPTIDLLPFSVRTAQVLMQIAKHPDLSNAHHDAHLPPSYNTLGVLAQLPPGEIPKRIEAGEITPELDRATAQGWAAVYQQAKQESLNAYDDAIDGFTKMLAYAKTYEPPADMSAGHRPVAEFARQARELAEIAEKWSTG